jgi:hypothetical protein
VKGSFKGQEVRLEFMIGNQEHSYVGMATGGRIIGNFTVKGRMQTIAGTWTAKRSATDKPPTPRILDFTPVSFYRELSADVPPVLRIWPGDTVRTKSVDAGGQDEKSQQRVMGGNPLTGPFYIEGAMPGDVLAITIVRLRVNRDWAMSGNGLVGRALTTDYAAENKQEWKSTRWHLDAEKQTATLEDRRRHPFQRVTRVISVAIWISIGSPKGQPFSCGYINPARCCM